MKIARHKNSISYFKNFKMASFPLTRGICESNLVTSSSINEGLPWYLKQISPFIKAK